MAAARVNSSLLLVSLVAALALGLGQAMPKDARIWGGADASAGVFPYVASIRVDGAHSSVGSIISEKHILTSAQSVSDIGAKSIDPSRVSCRVGSVNQFAGGQIVDVSAIDIHPSYGNFLHDMAILTLAKPLTFSDKVNKISLASEEEEVADDTSVTVTGWGLQQSGPAPYKLQHVALSVISSSQCESEVGYGYGSTLCLKHAANVGFCRGDYGSGVVSGSRLVGVASFAFGSCGTTFPDISSRVSYYRQWIDSVIA